MSLGIYNTASNGSHALQATTIDLRYNDNTPQILMSNQQKQDLIRQIDQHPENNEQLWITLTQDPDHYPGNVAFRIMIYGIVTYTLTEEDKRLMQLISTLPDEMILIVFRDFVRRAFPFIKIQGTATHTIERLAAYIVGPCPRLRSIFIQQLLRNTRFVLTDPSHLTNYEHEVRLIYVYGRAESEVYLMEQTHRFKNLKSIMIQEAETDNTMEKQGLIRVPLCIRELTVHGITDALLWSIARYRPNRELLLWQKYHQGSLQDYRRR